MKKGEKFKLDSAWWQSSKAATLTSDANLGALLKKYEAAQKSLKSEATLSRYDAALKLIAAIGDAAGKAAGKCVGPLHAETKAALATAPAVLTAESKPIMNAFADYKRKVDEARVKLVPLDKKASVFGADIERAAALGKKFRGALASGSPSLATRAYKEFSDAYGKLAKTGIALRTVPEGALFRWAKDMPQEDGKEVLMAMSTILGALDLYKREDKVLFVLNGQGPALIKQHCKP